MFVIRTGCNSISIPWDYKQHLYFSSMCPEINGITLALKHVVMGPWAWWGQWAINWLQLWADAEFQVELYWMTQIDSQTRFILACRTVSRDANPASYRVSPTVWDPTTVTAACCLGSRASPSGYAARLWVIPLSKQPFPHDYLFVLLFGLLLMCLCLCRENA